MYCGFKPCCYLLMLSYFDNKTEALQYFTFVMQYFT